MRKNKQKPVEAPETPQPEPPAAPPLPPEPAPEPVPEPVPEPERPPVEAQPEPIPAESEPEPAMVAPAEPVPAPISDEELPPPPTDAAEVAKEFPPIKTRKPTAFASIRRAGAVFGKDAGTIAKHGLVSSIILLVFLMIVFYIASYAMFTFASMKFGEGGGDGGDGDKGGNGPNLGNDGTLDANAGLDRTIAAGTAVTFSSAATTHTADIMYVEWTIDGQDKESGDSPTLYGPSAQYTFRDVGVYTVNLMVVDSKWNADGDNCTVTVNPSTSDNVRPNAVVNGTVEPGNSVMVGTPVFYDAANSTDNVGVVNWTWTLTDVIEKTRYGPKVWFTFQTTGDKQVSLVIRDAAGNINRTGGNLNVMPTDPGDMWPQARMNDLPQSVKVGDTITLDASQSNDDRGIAEYRWYITLNNTRMERTGQVTSFQAQGFGMYQIMLVVKDNAGNAATAESSFLSLTQGMDEPSMVTWTSTPLGQDIPFNVLSFAYGAALLASVIYLGGLFSKGFAHEIQKGTAKTLFFAPLSVTNMVFAKLLYPLVIGPLFMFPLLMISLSPLKQDPVQVLEIGIVAYVITALVLISAAYGSCLIYAATKRMSIKPTAVARSFMYLSLIGTLTIFAGLSYLMDQWFETTSWNQMYVDFGPKIAMFSPFHQGGLLLQNLLFGAPLSLDWIVFVIPAVLIVGGIVASRKLYGDIFSRE